jgi:cardiolipin synthase
VTTLDLILEIIGTLAYVVLTLGTVAHILLNKRDPRAAVGWIAIGFTLPFIGIGLYWLFGVNRIRTRARGWQERGHGMAWTEPAYCIWSTEQAQSEQFPFRHENFSDLRNLVDAVTRRELVDGNRITPLYNGEQAYPAMLDAIRNARESVCLSSYIFETNQAGRDFANVLIAAADRKVTVYVLIDALGACYSLPRAYWLFRKTAVRVAKFLPFSISGRGLYLNMRNHRKLLVVDGEIGFTGGMNIGDRHLLEGDGRKHVSDFHFKVEGPVVGHLQEAFLEDWGFATGDPADPIAHPKPVASPGAICRGISAGPNEDFDKLAWLVVGALNSARHSVRIMTPYFIPDRSLLAAINAAALRGVKVTLILPEKNNLPPVAWATWGYLKEFLRYGTHVYEQPPPFAHGKLLLVDNQYALVGSANLDQRSLRLNFEFALEVYDGSFCADMAKHFDQIKSVSRRVTLARIENRPLMVRLRDGFFKLFSPFL